MPDPAQIETVKRSHAAKGKSILELALYVAGIFSLVSVGFAGIKLGDLASSAKQDMTRMTQQVDRLVIITAGTATNIEKSTRSIQAKEDAEYTQIQAMSEQFNVIATNTNAGILELDDTIGSLNALVKNSDARMKTLTADMDADIRDLQPVMVGLNASLASLKVELDALPATTENINTALAGIPPIEKQATVILTNGAAISQDAVELSAHYKQVILAPVTKVKAAWNIFSRAMENIIGAAVGVKI